MTSASVRAMYALLGKPATVSADAHRSWRLYSFSAEDNGGYLNLDMIALRKSGVNQCIGAGGTADQSSTFGAPYGAIKAFEEDPTGFWHTNSANVHWARFSFPVGVEKEVTELALRCTNVSGRGPKHFKLQTSDDGGTTWDELLVVRGATGYTTGAVKTFAVPSTYVAPPAVAMLPLDGAHGSTTFTDLSGKTWTRTGTGIISTAVSKYGGASYQSAAGSYISCNHADFNYGRGDFSVSGWAYHTSDPANNGIFASRMSSTSSHLALARHGAGNAWQIYCGSLPSVAGAFPTGSQFFWELCRRDNQLYLFINGVKLYQAFNDADLSDESMFIGGYYNGSFTWPGYIDDVQALNYCPRTENYTPPTAARTYP